MQALDVYSRFETKYYGKTIQQAYERRRKEEQALKEKLRVA
jgi:hypothetical protein